MSEVKQLFTALEKAVEEPTLDVWSFMELLPSEYDALVDLYSWGENYDAGNPSNPFPLFLDLIGYSEDNYGGRVSNWGADSRRVGSLGYVELHKLARALDLYSDRPRECENILGIMLDGERY
jgi:hypothetical protein